MTPSVRPILVLAGTAGLLSCQETERVMLGQPCQLTIDCGEGAVCSLEQKRIVGEADDDGDGLSKRRETEIGTNPHNWEYATGLYQELAARCLKSLGAIEP